MSWIACFVFVAAAVLEVGGIALIRAGLRGDQLALVGAGLVALGCYGLVVNTLRWDFARLLGVYVAVFALTSTLIGRFAFREGVSFATWTGLSLIGVGGLVILLGD